MRIRTRSVLAVSTLLVPALLLTGCGDDDDPAKTSTGDDDMSVELVDAGGVDVGRVQLEEDDRGTEVSITVTGLSEGYHAFHVHETGLCEADSADPADPSSTGDFLSAGPHLSIGAAEGSPHGEHTGDLPSLLAGPDGRAELEFHTDRFRIADLRDGDGSAIVIHAGADNFANIPDRYDGPDEETLGAGDAGDRIACAVVPAG